MTTTNATTTTTNLAPVAPEHPLIELARRRNEGRELFDKLSPAWKRSRILRDAQVLAVSRSEVGQRVLAVERALSDLLDEIDSFLQAYPDADALDRECEVAIREAGLTPERRDGSSAWLSELTDHLSQVPEELAGWRHPLHVLYENLRPAFEEVEEEAGEEEAAAASADQAQVA